MGDKKLMLLTGKSWGRGSTPKQGDILEVGESNYTAYPHIWWVDPDEGKSWSGVHVSRVEEGEFPDKAYVQLRDDRNGYSKGDVVLATRDTTGQEVKKGEEWYKFDDGGLLLVASPTEDVTELSFGGTIVAKPYEEPVEKPVEEPKRRSQILSRAQQQVREFHETYGMPVADEPQLIETARADLRRNLIQEELDEYEDAYVSGDLTEIADALGDLLYVVYGAAIEHGINLEPVVDEIHRSNMSKLGEDGKPIYRADGKVLKGPDYSPPAIKPILDAQGA